MIPRRCTNLFPGSWQACTMSPSPLPPASPDRRAFLKALGLGGGVAGLPAAVVADERPSSLTITGIETFALEHRLARAMGPSTAMSNLKDALLVKITTDSGLVGWGETADVGGTRGIIEDHLKPQLLGILAMVGRLRLSTSPCTICAERPLGSQLPISTGAGCAIRFRSMRP